VRSEGTWIASLTLGLASIAVASPRAAAQQEGAAEPRPRCWHLGESIVVGAGETLDCSLVVVGGDVTVEADGVVAGDLAVPFGSADVEGTVDGDAFASGGLRLGEAARIQGNASSLGEVVVAVGAQVAGRTDRLSGQPLSGAARAPDVQAMASALGFLAILAVLAAITAALATVVAAEPVARARRAAFGSPQRVLGSLVLGMVAGILAVVTFVVTSLTIFLPIVIAALTLIGLVVGATALAERIGTPALPRAGRKARAAGGACALVALVFGPLLFRPPLAVFAVLLALDLLLAAASFGGGLIGLGLAWRTARLGGQGDADDGSAWRPATTGIPRHATGVRGDEPLAPSVPSGAPAPAPAIGEAMTAAGDAAPAAPTRPIALRDLPGMTPIYAQLLASEGIASLDALAAADAAAVVRMMVVPGVRGVDAATAEAWVRAAREVAAGGA